jgi:hypothetical protein
MPEPPPKSRNVGGQLNRTRHGAQGFFSRLFSGGNAATQVQHRSAKAERVSKKQVCDQIYRISREVIHQVDDRSEVNGAGLKEACEKLAECGRTLLSKSEGKHVRSGILKWVNGFEAAYKDLLQNNSPDSHDKIANLCFNYSEQLDRIVGIIRPLPAAASGA